MDVREIYEALLEVWPEGIGPETYPLLAGLICVEPPPKVAPDTVSTVSHLPVTPPVHLSGRDARRAIYTHVSNNPWVTAAEISQALQISLPTTGAHLRWLAKKGHLIHSADWTYKWATREVLQRVA